jgi:hypothetical protein
MALRPSFRLSVHNRAKCDIGIALESTGGAPEALFDHPPVGRKDRMRERRRRRSAQAEATQRLCLRDASSLVLQRDGFASQLRIALRPRFHAHGFHLFISVRIGARTRARHMIRHLLDGLGR